MMTVLMWTVPIRHPLLTLFTGTAAYRTRLRVAAVPPPTALLIGSHEAKRFIYLMHQIIAKRGFSKPFDSEWQRTGYNDIQRLGGLEAAMDADQLADTRTRARVSAALRIRYEDAVSEIFSLLMATTCRCAAVHRRQR